MLRFMGSQRVGHDSATKLNSDLLSPLRKYNPNPFPDPLFTPFRQLHRKTERGNEGEGREDDRKKLVKRNHDHFTRIAPTLDGMRARGP